VDDNIPAQLSEVRMSSGLYGSLPALLGILSDAVGSLKSSPPMQ